MNATLERLTAQFVQLIGPAAAGASPASSPAASPHGGAPIVSASPAPAADESRAGPRPALPQTAATTPAPAGTTSAAAAPAPAPAATPATAPKTAAPPAPPPPPPGPLQVTDHALKGYHLDATVNPDQVIAAATILDRQGFAIDAVTGVDWLAQNQMEVVYDYFHPLSGLRAVVRTRLPRAEPVVPTISGVFPGANWHERETHDFFGIKFDGHPNLTPFILPEDATFHPLRKDYQP